MIHIVERFRHHLLGNSFIFYVNHQNIITPSKQLDVDKSN
jgi:hypothetical protein